MTKAILQQLFGGFTARVLDHFLIFREFDYDMKNLERIFNGNKQLKETLQKLTEEELLLENKGLWRLHPDSEHLIKFVNQQAKLHIDNYLKSIEEK